MVICLYFVFSWHVCVCFILKDYARFSIILKSSYNAKFSCILITNKRGVKLREIKICLFGVWRIWKLSSFKKGKKTSWRLLEIERISNWVFMKFWGEDEVCASLGKKKIMAAWFLFACFFHYSIFQSNFIINSILCIILF